MTQKIVKNIIPKTKLIRDIGLTQRLVDSKKVAEALGAEKVYETKSNKSITEKLGMVKKLGNLPKKERYTLEGTNGKGEFLKSIKKKYGVEFTEICGVTEGSESYIFGLDNVEGYIQEIDGKTIMGIEYRNKNERDAFKSKIKKDIGVKLIELN
ncbi:MAG: hypothetical protein AABX88_00365 [Nanoarchaeota archaeon]